MTIFSTREYDGILIIAALAVWLIVTLWIRHLRASDAADQTAAEQSAAKAPARQTQRPAAEAKRPAEPVKTPAETTVKPEIRTETPPVDAADDASLEEALSARDEGITVVRTVRPRMGGPK